jgi:hypothetical protein
MASRKTILELQKEMEEAKQEYYRKLGIDPAKVVTDEKISLLKDLPEHIGKHVIDKIVKDGMEEAEVWLEASNVKAVLKYADSRPEDEREAILKEVNEHLDDVLIHGLEYFKKV